MGRRGPEPRRPHFQSEAADEPSSSAGRLRLGSTTSRTSRTHLAGMEFSSVPQETWESTPGAGSLHAQPTYHDSSQQHSPVLNSASPAVPTHSGWRRFTTYRDTMKNLRTLAATLRRSRNAYVLVRVRDQFGWGGPYRLKGRRFTAAESMWYRFGTESAASTAGMWHGYEQPEYVVVPVSLDRPTVSPSAARRRR